MLLGSKCYLSSLVFACFVLLCFIWLLFCSVLPLLEREREKEQHAFALNPSTIVQTERRVGTWIAIAHMDPAVINANCSPFIHSSIHPSIQ